MTDTYTDTDTYRQRKRDIGTDIQRTTHRDLEPDIDTDRERNIYRQTERGGDRVRETVRDIYRERDTH